MVEAAEDNLFRSCFSNWPRPPEQNRQNSFNGNVPKDDVVKTQKVDLSGLYKRKHEDNGVEDDIKDDGCGKIKVILKD